MLVLSRKVSQRLLIGDDIVITVVRIGPSTVRLGISAPSDMNIIREEIVNLDSKSANKLATTLMLHAAQATVEEGKTR